MRLPEGIRSQEPQQSVGTLNPAGWKRWNGSAWLEIVGPVDTRGSTLSTGVRKLQRGFGGLGESIEPRSVEGEDERPILGQHCEVGPSTFAIRVKRKFAWLHCGGRCNGNKLNGRRCNLIGNLHRVDRVEVQRSHPAIDRHPQLHRRVAVTDLCILHSNDRHTLPLRWLGGSLGDDRNGGETRTRLRNVTVGMVSGPDVLARRRHWGSLHLRWDRERFGWDGPAARPRWPHFLALTIAAVAVLAMAGAR